MAAASSIVKRIVMTSLVTAMSCFFLCCSLSSLVAISVGGELEVVAIDSAGGGGFGVGVVDEAEDRRKLQRRFSLTGGVRSCEGGIL